MRDDELIDPLGPELPDGGYTVVTIGRFLGETKGKHGVEVADWFPFLNLFCCLLRLVSVS